ncbi:vWA domain-containing protein [Gordonia sp. NPDC003429]
MNTDDAPGPRIDAAKSAVTSLVDSLPGQSEIGVVVFGGTVPSERGPQAGCADVETVSQLAPIDAHDPRPKIAGVPHRAGRPWERRSWPRANRYPKHPDRSCWSPTVSPIASPIPVRPHRRSVPRIPTSRSVRSVSKRMPRNSSALRPPVAGFS